MKPSIHYAGTNLANCLQAVSTGRSPEVWVLTSKALVLLDPSQNNTVLFSTNNVGYKKLSILDSTLLLTDETNVLRCVFVSNFKCSDPIQMPNHGPIKASLILPNGTILIASDRLYSLAPEKGAEPEQVLGAVRSQSISPASLFPSAWPSFPCFSYSNSTLLLRNSTTTLRWLTARKLTLLR